MPANKTIMNMPELPVFARSLASGFLIAETCRIGFYAGTALSSKLAWASAWPAFLLLVTGTVLCLIYLRERGAFDAATRMARSLRVDLLFAAAVGVWINDLASHWLKPAHDSVKQLDPDWVAAALTLLGILLISPLFRHFRPKRKNAVPQMYFIADEEIGDEKDDFLASDSEARSFGDAVLAGGAHPGLVFGVDGPWGVGKTSFINLAQKVWEKAGDRIIVCRFEPLRYASEVDLADRLIRELTSAIQREVFAPEFRPAVSRYSKLVKGKADVSFLGFKIALEPGQETLDELLDDIDDVLKRIGYRVIVVVDDLDRLDAKAINSVLFATRRTFKLSQATFVLCYDTEGLVASKDEESKAREFLEKFVTVKLSLFVDSSRICEFLLRDWRRSENRMDSIPSDTMFRLSAVLSELAEILGGDLAGDYLPLVGDLRKIKRFVNAMLLMQLEKSDLGRTDFNKRDLINLVLLNLSFPGLFRRIYSEETEGRRGSFSIQRKYGDRHFKNAEEFTELLKEHSKSARFLLRQLFDIDVLGYRKRSDIDDAALASRACFNRDGSRNLENYLKLIVRFATPEPQQTFVLYREAVAHIQEGKATVFSVLESADFRLRQGEYAHDQFWRVLANQCSQFNRSITDDAIDALVAYLPRYSIVGSQGRALRNVSIYSLLHILDRAGWGQSPVERRQNSDARILEIAERIFGEGRFIGNGLLTRLSDQRRGVIGWHDLMLFRLQCSADRQGQLFNLQNALLVHGDPGSSKDGFTNKLALEGMRKLSQQVFALFKRTYIDTGINFYSEVDSEADSRFLGEAPLADLQPPAQVSESVSAARSSIKLFVVYQLANNHPPTGSGVGCGFYDETGDEDKHGVSILMSEYAFGHCFNPLLDEQNVFYFIDHCLTHLSNSFLLEGDGLGYIATREIAGGFDPIEIGKYWNRHRELIRGKAALTPDRQVVTANYVATYGDLESVFNVLDDFSNEASEASQVDRSPSADIEVTAPTAELSLAGETVDQTAQERSDPPDNTDATNQSITNSDASSSKPHDGEDHSAIR